MVRSTATSSQTPAFHERELQTLQQECANALSKDAARFCFVHGPAGVGKTDLLAAFRRAIATSGARVFEARAPRGAPRAYGLFGSLISELLLAASETGIREENVKQLASRLAPVLQETSCPTPAMTEEHRLDLFDAVAELFLVAGRHKPVFLFHDVDGADRASLELLRFVAAATVAPEARAAGFYVIAYRDGAAIPEVLQDLVVHTPAAQLPLAGLDLDGIRAYLGRREVAEQLLRATGGLPTALDQLLQSPERPSELLLRRVKGLAPSEQDALLALAVLGKEACSDTVASLLAALRGQAPLDLPLRLHHLARLHLLEEADAGAETHYRFAREQDREVLKAQLVPADLLTLQLATGELLLARGEFLAAAEQLLAADPRGRGHAAALRAAEALASRCAYEDAARMYRRALEAASSEERRAIHRKLAELYRATADDVAALRHLGQARKGAPAAELRANRSESVRLLIRLGRTSTAERLALEVLEGTKLPDPADAAALTAFASLCEIRFLRGDYGGAQALAEPGLASPSFAPEARIQLRNSLGKVHLARGELAQAQTVFAANAAEAHAAGIPRERSRALINQGVVAHRMGDRRLAIARYQEGLAECGSDRRLEALALSNLGSLYFDSGELGSAVEHLGRALTAFTRARRDKEAAHAAANLASQYLFLGELDRAMELAQYAAAGAGRVGDPYLEALGQLVQGEIHEARGDWSQAIGALEPARDAFERLASPRFAAVASLRLARVHMVRGERTRARLELSRPALDSAARESSALRAERELCAGELSLVCGDLADAQRRLSQAKELLLAEPDLEGPFRVYHLLSRLRASAGDLAGAAADAARASQLLDELARRVPPLHRSSFLKIGRRAAVLAAASDREITPARVASALSLGPVGAGASAIIGSAAPLEKIRKVLDPVARSNATVLIRGESGTGKELIAEAIHEKSSRRDMPLVKVNCAAMPEDLLLSELFGHEKGSFTGAIRERKGRFELAEGGTLFLDEIGDISPKCQVALLRVLQEKEFERVGGTKTLKADVRVVCATNRDLEAAIPRGAFREDLYYRIKGVMIELPPLREREEDIAVLADHFLEKLARERGEPKKALSPEALELLEAYPWPGNIRELQNVVSAASIFAEGTTIGPEALKTMRELWPPFEADAPAFGLAPQPNAAPSVDTSSLDYFELARARGLSLKELRQEVETQCIQRALHLAGGNISEAARLLKMKRSRLSQIVNAEQEPRADVQCGDTEPSDSDLLGDES